MSSAADSDEASTNIVSPKHFPGYGGRASNEHIGLLLPFLLVNNAKQAFQN
jgi:hypothetical protein